MKKIEALMELLNSKFSFFNSNTFYLTFSVSVLLNPIAVWFQTYEAWTALSVEGISAVTFTAMLFLQSIAVGYSIKIKEAVILFAMGTSALGTIGILAALVIR